MKSLDANVVTQLESSTFMYAELIEFDFATPLYLSTASYDIVTSTLTSDGTQTYLAQGKFLSYSGVRQSDELRVNSVAVQLSGSTSTFVNIVLQDQYLHRTMRIYKVWIDIANGQQIADPVLIYSGTITGGDVSDDSTECQVSLTTSNEFYDFEKVAGRKTNDNSQKREYPGDNGMIYSTGSIADIRWGKTS